MVAVYYRGGARISAFRRRGPPKAEAGRAHEKGRRGETMAAYIIVAARLPRYTHRQITRPRLERVRARGTPTAHRPRLLPSGTS